MHSQASADKAQNDMGASVQEMAPAAVPGKPTSQQVRVERVTVESGAQAVVGNVNHGGRGHGEN